MLYSDVNSRNTIQENRRTLRRYIRLVGSFDGMLDATNAKKYFIMMHNFLALEEMFYDQCTMASKNLNKHLRLIGDIKYVSSAIRVYQILREPGHKVRYAIETMDDIEDVRVYLKEQGYQDIYTKLILNK